MNESTQIPTQVAEIIDRKRQAIKAERDAKEEADRRTADENKNKGQAMYAEWLEQIRPMVPGWLWQYLKEPDEELDYARIVAGWDRLENCSIFFSIPGLAMIEYFPRKDQWRCESAGRRRDYDNAEPYLHFNNNSYWQSDLESVLLRALSEREEYDEHLQEYVTRREEEARRAEQDLQEEEKLAVQQAEKNLRNELQAQQQRAEEWALLDAIKHDDVAIHLLKAFVLLRDERSYFEERLSDADETISSIENRWSRRAEELRRQADDAQRRAEEERSRLQSDLDDAESQLRKAKRGW